MTIRATVTLADGTIRFRDFQSQNDAQDWMDSFAASGVYGKPDRWVRDGDEDVSAATEQRTVTDGPVPVDADGVPSGLAPSHVEYHLPAEYTVTTADVTDQVAQEQSDAVSILKGLEYQQVGAKAIAMLTAVNLEKKITADQLQQMASNQTLMLAITLVGNGALKTGRDLFSAAGAAFYTADEIARIVRPINQSGLV